MSRAARTIGLILAMLGGLACTASDPTAQPQFFPVTFSSFLPATSLAVTTPGTEVIRDQATWDAFWQLHAPLAGPAPVVDFNQDMLIGVFWGAGGSGCFSFVDAIENVRIRVDQVNTFGVIQVDVGPLPDLGSCATPVNPFQVVVVDTVNTTVEFAGMVPG